MAEGNIPKPYNGLQIITGVTKDSGATYWTINNQTIIKQGQTAFVRITATCAAGQDTSVVLLTTLPSELKPVLDQYVRAHHSSNGYGSDCNVTIDTNGRLYVQLPEANSGRVSFRMFLVYPTAT